MLELRGNRLHFTFPEIHPEASFDIEFQRTFRIPDDGKEYPLPPGFGQFPVKLVDDCKDRVPAKWAEHGGVMLPMYQAEAMWIRFIPNRVSGRQGDTLTGAGCSGYPFAVRVATGKVNAVSGKEWRKRLHKDEYLVCPPQPWLDGFCVEAGKIRQFVAMPLGWGLSVEQQVTGKEEHGGLQIEVYPMKAEEFERRFPKYPESRKGGQGILRSFSLGSQSNSYEASATMDFMACDSARGIAVASADMGLGAGGLMKQQIYGDEFGKDVWAKTRERCFVHLANSFAWEVITKHAPPPTPCTAEAYAERGLPWFDHYLDGVPIQKGGKNLKAIKTVMALGFQKGLGVFPSNESVKVKKKQIVQTASKDAVRNGAW